MTDRKPPGATWESWIDAQIRQGLEQGAFDRLPGTGKPIPDLDRPRDELWWVKDKLRREGVSYLPPALELRRQVEDARAEIESAVDEATVLSIVERINERIRYVNSHVVEGPPSTLAPLDPDHELARWRAASERRATG